MAPSHVTKPPTPSRQLPHPSSRTCSLPFPLDPSPSASTCVPSPALQRQALSPPLLDLIAQHLPLRTKLALAAAPHPPVSLLPSAVAAGLQRGPRAAQCSQRWAGGVASRAALPCRWRGVRPCAGRRASRRRAGPERGPQAGGRGCLLHSQCPGILTDDPLPSTAHIGFAGVEGRRLFFSR